MKKWLLLTFASFMFFNGNSQNLPFLRAHTYSTGTFNSKSTGDIRFEKTKKRLFITNVTNTKIEIRDYSDIFKPFTVTTLDLNAFLTRIRSIDAADNLIVVVGDGQSPQSTGKMIFYNSSGTYLRQYSVGVTPKSVRISPSGTIVAVANEGRPDSSYTTDPLGTISVLDFSLGLPSTPQSFMKTIDFQLLDSVAYDPLINVYGNNGMQPPSLDLEPEAVTIDWTNQKGYVAIQENNALAIVNLFTGELDTILGLGYQDHSQTGLDASNVAENINIDTYSKLYGMHQPGGIEAFTHNSTVYLITTNTGAKREYTGYNEVRHLKNQPLDPSKFSNLATLLNDTVLGQLEVTTSIGDVDGNGLYDSIFSFGSRSISIWDNTGQEVWNSGDEIEKTLEMLHAANFNSDNDDNSSYKSRSNKQGAEPHSVVVGTVDGVRYAFIALRRMGGIMIYDISDPLNPQFELYELNRDFSKPANDPDAGDLGPVSLAFVPATGTTEGFAALFVANEISSTVSVYQIGQGIGLDEFEDGKVSNFFPNPSDGIFYTQEKGDFEVYDQSGKVVLKVKDKNYVDLSGQPDGLYLISNVNGTSYRIIKK